MSQIDLRKFIMPVTLKNTDENLIMGNKAFNTTDYVFLDADEEKGHLAPAKRVASATDYALANGVFQWWGGLSRKDKKGTSPYWLRSAYAKYGADSVSVEGKRTDSFVGKSHIGISPSLHLDLKALIAERKTAQNFGKISHVKNSDGKVVYHTINFGYYPNTHIKNPEELEKMLVCGQILPSGKKYIGHIRSDGTFVENLEYKYGGQRYVRVKLNPYEEGNFYADKTKIPTDGYAWFKVEPITWIIRNWEMMPKSINPMGLGLAKYMDLRAEEVIMGGILS